MSETFRRGDQVEWSFRGHTVAGRVRRRLTARTEVAGRTVAASKDDPRYLVRSDKSGKRRRGARRRCAVSNDPERAQASSSQPFSSRLGRPSRAKVEKPLRGEPFPGEDPAA